jgi:hypothetical protein
VCAPSDGARRVLAYRIPALLARVGIFLLQGDEMSDYMENGGEEGAPRAAEEARRDEARAAREEKWTYLRAVYPLNPGIPHYVDFPLERE